jgi:hypothetical protein
VLIALGAETLTVCSYDAAVPTPQEAGQLDGGVSQTDGPVANAGD